MSLQKVRNKLARAKLRCVGFVESIPKFHYNDLLQTCQQHVKIVCRVTNKSTTSWQLPLLRVKFCWNVSNGFYIYLAPVKNHKCQDTENKQMSF